MNALKRETRFKSTEIDWLEMIPSNWGETKVKYLFNERVEKGFPNEPLLTATQSQGVIRKEDYEHSTVTAQKDLHLLKLVRIGDFVISLRSFQGGIEIAHYQGIISPAYTVLNIEDNFESRYVKHLFKSRDFINGLTTFVTGIREGQNIDYSKFRRSFIPVPPFIKQIKIANFLDKKTAEIQRFIQLKEKTIELLKERKTAIITQAVTKGLNPNAEMKDSGIEWLGDIPAHWEVKKLKHLVKDKLKYGANESAELSNPEFPRYIRITDFNSEGTLRDDTFKSLPPKTAADFLLEKGDILFARSGGTVGKTFLFKNDAQSACFAGYLIRARVNSLITFELLFLYTKSGVYESWKDSIFNQATIQNIGADKYSTLQVPIPPINEQIKIVEMVNERVNELNYSIKRIVKEINLIKEYRESLISEAVTGKIDVSQYATEAHA